MNEIATHLKFADVAVLHHNGEESDDHLRARPEEMELVKKGHGSQLEVQVSPQHNLPLAPLLGIVDAAQGAEEESQNLSSQVLPPGLLVIHDASRGGQHHLEENNLHLKGVLH